ncbi:hypothetical protein, partial [Streptomyces prasinus]|uniref:hypothetical protein n=1 Tax=Streptomyces prasinus TaxID=67345 RepID=UPI0033B50149
MPSAYFGHALTHGPRPPHDSAGRRVCGTGGGPGTSPGRWVQTASILHSDGDAMDVAVVDGRM